MRRLLLPLLLLAVALPAGAAQLLPVAQRPSFLAGESWTFRYSDGTRATRTFLREEAGGLLFEVSQVWLDGSVSLALLHLTPDLATRQIRDEDGTELQRYEPHSLGLRFPLGVGQGWEASCRRFDEGKEAGSFTGAFRVVGVEAVAGPAGIYQAYRVEGETFDPQAPTRRWRFTHWYAPAVRMEVQFQAVDPDGNRVEYELAEHRPAGYRPPAAVLPGPGPGPQAFLGSWEGHWRELTLATRLSVEKIEGETASLVYWRGAYQFPGLARPSQQRAEGRFLDARTLRVEVYDDARRLWVELVYTLQADGSLAATWQSGGGTISGTLTRAP